jgi:hypothetical protein
MRQAFRIESHLRVMARDAALTLFIPERLRLGVTLEFRVIWEIEIHAASPEEAAQEARAIQLKPDISATIFAVWEHARERMHRIDVERHAGELDPVELIAVRACLRSLQCAPGVPDNIKDLVSALLIFLDREDAIFKRVELLR